MASRKIFTIRNVIAVILAGALGDILGVILKNFIPKSPARDVILYSSKVGLEELKINLIIIDFKFGFILSINILSFVLIFLMIYLLQKI
ncbi:MAG: hypothetical protein ABDH37_02630 [Candidatus Hydrothermales bacterium]